MFRRARTAAVRATACAALALALSPFAAPAASSTEVAPSPYAAFAGRTIKALSPEQVTQYLEGHGMGLALPAELNGHPGPRHVLDMAGPLELTDGQKAGVQRAFDVMHERAVDIGRRIVAGEAEVDSLFASNAMDEDTLRDRLERLAALQGELRFAHLRAHLETKSLLTAAQVARYEELRGYAKKDGDPPMNHPHDPGGHGH